MIYFKSIKWKNLLSTGNTFTEIVFDKHKTTLIVGENGAGKSTIIDALCFGLYEFRLDFQDSRSSLPSPPSHHFHSDGAEC